MAQFIFTLLGTGGDVWPGVAIASELQRRGHSVVVLSYDYFADEMERTKVPFISIGNSKDYLANVTTARFWERNGTSKGLDENGYLRQAFRPVYD
jgi:UDP:flavonoid glycosyltransferase YjiC (YdhE family)